MQNYHIVIEVFVRSLNVFWCIFRQRLKRSQSLIVCFSIMYWFCAIAIDCWKIDHKNIDGKGESLAPRLSRSPTAMSRATAAVARAFPVAESNAAANSITTFLNTPHQQHQPQQQHQQQQQQQHVFYACPMNNMCQCAGFPNETTTLVEINCSEIDLYKFPGKLYKRKHSY